MSRDNMFYWQSDRPYTAEQIKTIFLDRKDDYDRSALAMAASISMGEKVLKLGDPVNFGSVNIVCPFTTVAGREGVIRAHPKQVKNEYFFAESKAMDLAHSVGVPVPETIDIDDSKTKFEFDYMVTTMINGQVMQAAVEAFPSVHHVYLRQIGRYLGKMHTLNTSGYGFFDNELARKGVLRGIHSQNEEHFIAALDLDEYFYQQYPGWVDSNLIKKSIAILKSKTHLAKCDKPTLIHNDVADWNVVVDRDSVAGILDWDECFSGDPVFEFATLSLFYSDQQMASIKQGYQEVKDLPIDYDEKFSLYVLRYIINKSKISIKKLSSFEKESTRNRLNIAITKLKRLVNLF